ncbi:probable phytol kinase 3, chloroplastic isoform X1 [Olea europaea var. sylvestris]|uniref:probable phytol kinase 3, chloroplastic isoform X1 n=2 Tax=Olea europaea var. sylvestris TaxID=158386 RepID=UPI000C1D27E9|nr:probable phytol kinase 3, chloroplastic isoform X1 [Olea europaea var. sylvestris]
MASTIFYLCVTVKSKSKFYFCSHSRLFSSNYSPLTSSSDSLHRYKFGRQLEGKPRRTIRRTLTSSVAMFAENPVVSDVIATVLSGGIALSLLRLWEETAKRGLFDQKLNRKLVHVSVGLAFMLCWPMFSNCPSSGRQGAIIASLVPAVNIIKMLLLGLGIWKDYATVKSMSRFGDHRELLKGPLYYASTITLAGAIYWRTSPIAIAAICNLCAGDGIADIVGRRFGSHKLPYNRNKSIVGSIAMATAGFLACIGYMHYFSSFGYVQESPKMVLGFLVVSLAASLVESHPLSTELDDNLTVPLASVLVGSFVF